MKQLMLLLKGKRVKGEPLPPVVIRIGYYIEKPDFFDWCRDLNVSCRTNSLAIYSPSKPQVKC